MSSSAARFFVCLSFIVSLSLSAVPQTSPKPLRASELLALQAGGALPANMAHDIGLRGVNFHFDDNVAAQLKQAGAEPVVLAALNGAKVVALQGAKADKELLQELSKAAVLMKDKQYDEAVALLTNALNAGFAGPETGFVMGELLRRKGEFEEAASVYAEVLREDPDFPELHTKISYVLYRLGDLEGALREARQRSP